MKATDVLVSRHWVDLSTRAVRHESVRAADLEDALGGIGRAMKILEGAPVDDAYDPAARLVMNLGILSGTQFMTGLRTFFHAWSPLKSTPDGRALPMWAAGSCKFGTKLRQLGAEEVVFTGRCERPALLRIVREGGETRFVFEDAVDLAGLRVNAKVQTLHRRFPHAHFAVLGPAGENFASVRYAAIALSTENQLRSGDAKPRFCGRGGIGGVMGSKNLVAIAADCEDPPAAPQPPGLRELNLEVARGKGSMRYREKDAGGSGGTWFIYEALGPLHALPETNFDPTGTGASAALERGNVEKTHAIVAESCFRCGIRCHKNVHDRGADGKTGRFRAKLDYEPLNLLTSNLGIFDAEAALDLVALVDDLGMDAISLGATLGFAMEFNRRHAADGRSVAGGIRFGDVAATTRLIEEIAAGRCEVLGQGATRLSESLGETGYAMHCKGVEFPAYLPQTNPGYPFALAGGHMSMRTYLLLVFERETGLDYWVDAITRRGPQTLRDDLVGVCKFAGMTDEDMAKAVGVTTGLEVTADELQAVALRTHLRGWRIERGRGMRREDYVMPDEAHRELPRVQLPHFNTPEFFAALRDRVVARFDELAAAAGSRDGV